MTNDSVNLKFAIETHGCKLNQSDSLDITTDFTKAGFTQTDNRQDADVYVVNTCTVTHVSDRKARQALRKARRRNPNLTVVATGCYAERAPEELRTLGVDLVLGNKEKIDLVRKLIEFRNGSTTPCADGREGYLKDTTRIVNRTRPMLKIQEGCNQICAYCIVPRVRGREVSISPAILIERINQFVADGYSEVVLTGTQLGTYGYDLPDIDLRGLLELILQNTEISRLRVSSLQPQEIGTDLLELWSDPRLCPHFHIPLQSGSSSILRRMRRRYNKEDYLQSVELTRAIVENVSITTDVIVGFPGETADDFANTRDVCEAVVFSAVHLFKYSSRPGTTASHLTDTVGPVSKQTRLQELMRLTNRSANRHRTKYLGHTRKVLWEHEIYKNGVKYWTGLTDNYIRVGTQSQQLLRNTVTDATLTGLLDDVVVAQIPT